LSQLSTPLVSVCLFVCLLRALWGLRVRTSCVFGNLKPEKNKFDASVTSSSGKIKCFILLSARLMFQGKCPC
jgi:hypothetical protein